MREPYVCPKCEEKIKFHQERLLYGTHNMSQSRQISRPVNQKHNREIHGLGKYLGKQYKEESQTSIVNRGNLQRDRHSTRIYQADGTKSESSQNETGLQSDGHNCRKSNDNNDRNTKFQSRDCNSQRTSRQSQITHASISDTAQLELDRLKEETVLKEKRENDLQTWTANKRKFKEEMSPKQDNQCQAQSGATDEIVTRLLTSRSPIQCNFCLETQNSMQYYTTLDRKMKSCCNCLDNFKRWLIQGSTNGNLDWKIGLSPQPRTSKLTSHSTSAPRAPPCPEADASEQMVRGHELRKSQESCQHQEQHLDMSKTKTVPSEHQQVQLSSLSSETDQINEQSAPRSNVINGAPCSNSTFALQPSSNDHKNDNQGKGQRVRNVSPDSVNHYTLEWDNYVEMLNDKGENPELQSNKPLVTSKGIDDAFAIKGDLGKHPKPLADQLSIRSKEKEDQFGAKNRHGSGPEFQPNSRQLEIKTSTETYGPTKQYEGVFYEDTETEDELSMSYRRSTNDQNHRKDKSDETRKSNRDMLRSPSVGNQSKTSSAPIALENEGISQSQTSLTPIVQNDLQCTNGKSPRTLQSKNIKHLVFVILRTSINWRVTVHQAMRNRSMKLNGIINSYDLESDRPKNDNQRQGHEFGKTSNQWQLHEAPVYTIYDQKMGFNIGRESIIKQQGYREAYRRRIFQRFARDVMETSEILKISCRISKVKSQITASPDVPIGFYKSKIGTYRRLLSTVVRTVDNLNLPTQSMNKEELAAKYPYQIGTPFIGYTNATPGIIIGSDMPRFGTQLEVIETKGLIERWRKWLANLPEVKNVKIPRLYSTKISLSTPRSIQMHVLVDASEDAFSAVVYLRIEDEDGTEVAFVGSKARVAPLKHLLIPREELQGSVLGTRLSTSIKNASRLKIDRWTDSATVISWLNSDHRKYSQFVAHRVGEILENSDVHEWRWIPTPTKDNVADEATKWTKIPKFNPSNRWFRGPEFLRQSEDQWPKKKPILTDDEEEMKTNFKFHSGLLIPRIIDPERFSNYKRMVRSLAYAIRFTYPKARIMKTHMGSNGQVRRAKVEVISSTKSDSKGQICKVNKIEMWRSAHKLALLDVASKSGLADGNRETGGSVATNVESNIGAGTARVDETNSSESLNRPMA